MVRAAATGAIDFARADLLDVAWWRKLFWIIGELGTQERREVLRLQHDHWASLAPVYRGSNLAVQTLLDSSTGSMAEYVKLAFPWVKTEVTTPGTASREDLLQQWRDTWGHPGDPKYEAMMAHNERLFQQLHETQTRRQRRLAREQEIRDGLRAADPGGV